jgi:hypothetical protein
VAITSLTVSDIRARALRKAGESASTDRFDPDDLIEWIAEAQLAVLGGVVTPQGLWIEGLQGMGGKDTLDSLVEDEPEYPLDQEVRTITGVYYKQSDTIWKRVRYIPWGEQGQINLWSSSEPLSYYTRRNVIGFRPVPDSAQTDVIRIDYYAWDDRLSATTDEIFGGEALFLPWQHILVPHLVASIFEHDQKLDLANAWMDRFYRQLRAARNQLGSRNQDSAATILARGFGEADGPIDDHPVLDSPFGNWP